MDNWGWILTTTHEDQDTYPTSCNPPQEPEANIDKTRRSCRCSNNKDDNHYHDDYDGSEEGNNTDLNVYGDYNYANDDSDDTHVHSYLCIEQSPLEDKMLPSAKFWIFRVRQPNSEKIVVM